MSEKTIWPERLKQGIVDAGLKQADIARRLNLSKSTVSRWLRGVMAPEAPHRIALTRILGMSDRWLFPDLPSPVEVSIPPERMIELIGDELVKELTRRNIPIDPKILKIQVQVIVTVYQMTANQPRPIDAIPDAVKRVIDLKYS